MDCGNKQEKQKMIAGKQKNDRESQAEKQRMHKHIEDLQAALERMKTEQRAIMEQARRG